MPETNFNYFLSIDYVFHFFIEHAVSLKTRIEGSVLFPKQHFSSEKGLTFRVPTPEGWTSSLERR